jgi:hypothetical protein
VSPNLSSFLGVFASLREANFSFLPAPRRKDAKGSIALSTALFLSLFSPTFASAQETISEDIVVTAQTFRRFKASTRKDEGNWSCKVESSTGYDDVDKRACGGMIKCSTAVEPRFYSTEGLAWAKRDWAGYRKQYSKDYGKCFNHDRRAMIAEYRARRRAKK